MMVEEAVRKQRLTGAKHAAPARVGRQTPIVGPPAALDPGPARLDALDRRLGCDVPLACFKEGSCRQTVGVVGCRRRGK
jgi:hypothetical protein